MLKSALPAAMLATAIFSTSANASGLPDYPFIHTSGEAFQFVMPDLGEIDFEISAFNASPEAAVALVQQRVAEIQQLMAEQGAADGSVTFSDVRREMRKGTDPAAAEYDIKCTVHINVSDLTKWRAILEPLIAKPNLDAFATTFGTTDRKTVERQLVIEAIHDAQDRAQAMATGLGRKVGAAAGISTGELRNITRSFGLMPADRNYAGGNGKRPAQDRSELLMVTALKMQQTVDVIFKIK